MTEKMISLSTLATQIILKSDYDNDCKIKSSTLDTQASTRNDSERALEVARLKGHVIVLAPALGVHVTWGGGGL